MALRTTRSARRGSLLIELAIVLPLFLMLIMGLLEYGWILLKSQQITNAARQGARIGARPAATSADVDAAVANAMSVAGLSGSGYVVTITPGDPAGLASGELFTVAVSVTYSNIGFGVPLVPTPATLASSVAMAREGPP